MVKEKEKCCEEKIKKKRSWVREGEGGRGEKEKMDEEKSVDKVMKKVKKMEKGLDPRMENER